MPVFIYCLKDPMTGDVRYIGQTNNLKRRLGAHLSASAKERNHLGNWLRSLNGEKPLLAILHEVAEGESWAEEERRYISCARAMGVDLVNGTDGGEGTPGARGPKSPEHNAKNSAAHKGVPHSPEHRAANSAAHKGPRGPLSPEHCAALRVPKWSGHGAAVSAAITGVPKSPEQCANMSAARKGVPWSAAQRAAYERSHPSV